MKCLLTRGAFVLPLRAEMIFMRKSNFFVFSLREGHNLLVEVQHIRITVIDRKDFPVEVQHI